MRPPALQRPPAVLGAIDLRPRYKTIPSFPSPFMVQPTPAVPVVTESYEDADEAELAEEPDAGYEGELRGEGVPPRRGRRAASRTSTGRRSSSSISRSPPQTAVR